MFKPPTTSADMKATGEALREKHAAENTLLKAFRERKPKEGLDHAISSFKQANDRYRSLVAKFFQNYPV
ncbi:MAG: hypothetical protein WB586_12275 [Chthoniobacterales bacterium]